MGAMVPSGVLRERTEWGVFSRESGPTGVKDGEETWTSRVFARERDSEAGGHRGKSV